MMHVDNKKLIELLVTNSGLEKAEVEENLASLIDEINSALTDDDAYEIEDFGVFSKLGNNVLFIPSKDMETEINYKYVGMEPIEMEDKVVGEKSGNPIEEQVNSDAAEAEFDDDDYDDPFEEIFGKRDEELAESEVESEDEDDSELDLDDKIIDELIEEESKSEEDLNLKEAIEGTLDSSKEEEDSKFAENLADIFGETKDVESNDESEEEIEEKESEHLDAKSDTEIENVKEEETNERKPADVKNWGIDSYKEDNQESAFDSMFAKPSVNENDDEEEDEDIDFSDLEDDPFAELEKEEDTISFADEEGDDFEEKTSKPKKAKKEEIIPVITNVGSGKQSKKQEKEAADEKNKKAQDDDEKIQIKDRSLPPKKKREGGNVFLTLIIALLFIMGGGYALAYFGVVQVDGITPNKLTAQFVQQSSPTPVQNNNPTTVQESENVVPQQTENLAVSTPEEVSAPEQSEPTSNIPNGVSSDPSLPAYGLNGTLTEAGNNGFTIVLFTLSSERNAINQVSKLRNEGFRAFKSTINSPRYGSLYRVSVGQFRTQVDAVNAVDNLSSEYTKDYAILKIQ